VVSVRGICMGTDSASGTCERLGNKGFELDIRVAGGKVLTALKDLRSGDMIVDDEYIYRVVTGCSEGKLVWEGLRDIRIDGGDQAVTVRGKIAALELVQTFRLPEGTSVLEEDLSISNLTGSSIAVEHLETGFQRQITDDAAHVLPELTGDRLIAIPFRHKATDPPAWDNAFTLEQLLINPGAEHRATAQLGYGYAPALHRASEGWAWQHGEYTFGIFKFNQENMQFSVIGLESRKEGVWLRFGGAAMIDGEPSSVGRIGPGERIFLGRSHYEVIPGGYHKAAYAFRRFLDEQGCSFPRGYDPPVHWNELYDNPEWNVQTPGHPSAPRHARKLTYTRRLIEKEAAKAVEYSAGALYLDPGWDTDFGTLIWGDEWLGPRGEFIKEMHESYGLAVSLHCPLATWMSRDGGGVASWPAGAMRMDAEGNVIQGSICLGARQYLDEAAKRLLSHCEEGVKFLMFDGNWWNGGCWNPDHGHPVPYTKEDHCRALLELAQRVHEKYPHVIIEMHDMITGGSRQRYTPVYYKYGLPGSYDENWGFELMWQPMEDILSGRARSLYYYNLACNIPVYLHIDLRDDNEHCLSLWWYASTCRHLGIGGTHRNPVIADAQKKAMRVYRRLKPFYTRGQFYGCEEHPEEVHFHVLREKKAAVVNLFNLEDTEKVVQGSISVEELGIDPDQWYITPGPHLSCRNGRLYWSRRLPSYGTDVLELWPVSSLKHFSNHR